MIHIRTIELSKIVILPEEYQIVTEGYVRYGDMKYFDTFNGYFRAVENFDIGNNVNRYHLIIRKINGYSNV